MSTDSWDDGWAADHESSADGRRRGTSEAWESLMERMTSANHTQAVRADRYNEAAWKAALEEVGSLRDMWMRYTRTEDCADEFLQDFFQLMMQGDPEVRDRDDMHPEFVPNRDMVEAFAKYPEVASLRSHTRNHLLPAVMAMLSMDSEIRAAFDKMRAARDAAKAWQEQLDAAKELGQQARDDADQNQQDQKDQQDQQDQPGDGGEEAGNGSPSEEQLDQAAQAAQQAQHEAENRSKAAALSAGLAIRNAAKKAEDQLQQEATLASAYGVEDGDLRRMNFDQRRKLMDRLRGNRIAKFASLIGSFRAFAEASWRRQVTGVPSEIAGVELSGDLTKITPGELVNLAHPLLTTDLLRRHVSGELLTWQVRGRERQGRGPITVVCDESGSMAAEDVGGVSREAWSKALTLALMDTAHRQGRPFHYVGFSSPRQVWQIDLSKPDLDSAIEMTEHFFGGGTSYEGPLQLGLQIADEHQSTFGQGRGDVVFISDDEYTSIAPRFLEEWNEARTRLDMRCFGISINTRGGSVAMNDLCDSVRPIAGVVAGGEVDAVGSLFGDVLGETQRGAA